MSDLARQVGLHPIYVARAAFRARFGCSVGEYVTRDFRRTFQQSPGAYRRLTSIGQ